MSVRLRGRAHLTGDWVGESDLLGRRGVDWRPHDLSRLLADLPRRLGLSATTPFERGDVLVAGRGLGVETSTDWPALLLALHGFGAVVCESVDPAFRGALLHMGVPVFVLPSVRSLLLEGDDVILNAETGMLENVTSHRVLMASPLSAGELRVCRAAPARLLMGAWEARVDPDVLEQSAARPVVPVRKS